MSASSRRCGYPFSERSHVTKFPKQLRNMGREKNKQNREKKTFKVKSDKLP
jgi:hypothetical protein